MGVFRTGRDRLDSFCRLPHARGGVSGRTKRPAKNFASSPRPWGCFPGYKIASHRPAVFPTPVGVFPFASARRFTAPGLPHARGGVSTGRDRLDSFCPSSPRPWGCFSARPHYHAIIFVFPTPVGVFLSESNKRRMLVRLPHARGGVSAKAVWVSCSSRSSPRPWGCFPEPLPLRDSCKVFPTPVGVFLNLRKGVENAKGLPHARGGVSGCAGDESDQHLSSPRPWGCFFIFIALCPIVTSLPHARGGVSISRKRSVR